ncbi:MAG: multidrug effflux MFS transporter [Nocardioidaceae bacterium]|nr:multidrug effflux MFS transporter [Nocardioidaceae bacterium]
MSFSRPWLPALILVTAVGPLATDTYLASLPAMQADLHTSAAVAQLTMTAFIGGMAIGQVLSGPVSDAHGRRRLVIAGSVVFAATSLLCAVATTGPLLVLLRLAQGLAAGVGVSVGRAAVSDTYAGPRAAAVFGTLSTIGLIGPVVAPVIGSGLLHVGDWRTVFLFLLAVGVLMVVLASTAFPETLVPERRQPSGLGDLARRTQDLLRDGAFVAPVVVQCLVVAGFFVYIGGSSIVLQSQYAIGPDGYTLVFAGNALAMVLASLTFRLLVMRTGAEVLRRLSLAGLLVSASYLVVSCLVATDHRPPLAVVWAGLALMTASLGLFFPASTVIVQAAGIRSAGTAAALGGGLPFLTGALTTPLTGLLDAERVLPMTSATFGFIVVAVVVAARFSPTRTVEPLEEIRRAVTSGV